MKPLALSSIRQQNLRKVLDLLTLTPAMTRLELSEAAGLSQMTVTNLVDLLKEQGVLQFKPIAREEKDRPAQGRKADVISLCGKNKAWLIVDISNRQFTMTLMGFNMAPLLALHDDQQGEYIPRLEDFLRKLFRRRMQRGSKRPLQELREAQVIWFSFSFSLIFFAQEFLHGLGLSRA